MEIIKYNSNSKMTPSVTNAAVAYVRGYAGKKNQFANEAIHVTPMMQQMFVTGAEYQAPDVFERPELLNFKKISINEVKTRKITEEEYNALPSFCKNKKSMYLRGIFKGIFPLAMMLFGILVPLIGLVSSGQIQPFLILFGLIFFFVGFILGLPYMKNRIIKPDSEVVVGNIAFFTEKETPSVEYSPIMVEVGVAFYEDKTFVKAFYPVTSFDKMERDMKVLSYNNMLFYLKDGKFQLDHD